MKTIKRANPLIGKGFSTTHRINSAYRTGAFHLEPGLNKGCIRKSFIVYFLLSIATPACAGGNRYQKNLYPGMPWTATQHR